MTDEPFTRIAKTVSATAAATIDVTGNFLESVHAFIKVKFLDSGGAVITPTAGTYDFTVQPDGMDNFETITDGSAIDATAAVSQLSFLANASAVKYTPTAIAGNDVTNIVITLTANKS